ncbi:hypothetical protein CDAR_480241 [Caerostris darwini]|uniref:Uncharacterized protein n=1 Tax=Caerostris darwini TaxID=1538125 RepID=A0AAV4V0A1_9ARAC|nr:hypothetical protein CDAR_480241 [Caerostris darwini]
MARQKTTDKSRTRARRKDRSKESDQERRQHRRERRSNERRVYEKLKKGVNCALSYGIVYSDTKRDKRSLTENSYVYTEDCMLNL